MKVITRERGTQPWREAHRGKVSASDAPAILAASGTKRRAALVNRLVLDLEGHGLHTDEHPEPWDVQHEADLRCALACYRARTGQSVLETGFVVWDVLQRLGASPHGLAGRYGCVHFRVRRSLRAYRSQTSLTRAETARVQTTMTVCDRLWCDVTDYWDGGGQARDLMRTVRVDYDHGWFLANVAPRLLEVWSEVREALRARNVVALAPMS